MASNGSATIAFGADHGGFALKQHLIGWLKKRGYQVFDCGTLDGSRCDYPVIAAAVASRVANGQSQLGILIDGAGIGSSMMANKFPGVRAALCYDVSSANNSREHNDANVLTLGASLIGRGLAEQIVERWLKTECTEPRHQKRVAMIGELAAFSGSCGPSCGPAVPLATGGQFGVAGPGRDAHNAVPSSGAMSVVGSQGATLRESAANWLTMTHSPSAPSSASASSLAPQDVDRIVQRLRQLVGTGPSVRGDLVCFGDACFDIGTARDWISLGAERLSTSLGGANNLADVAKYIDHTLLKPDATKSDIDKLCDEAREHSFASVCVNPYWVPFAAAALRGCPVKVCTVVGFPLGATSGQLKALEARRAIREGAREIDMVINIGALKSDQLDVVYNDIRSVVDACEDGRALSKVIIETALLTDEEKVKACVAARRARADFVKTSTGFASAGATAADVALMSRVVADARMGVKASGGVRSYGDFATMVQAGATRIGASAGIKILKQASAGDRATSTGSKQY